MRRIAAYVTTGMLLLSASAQAQSRAQQRDGLAISFGLGGGSATVTCPGCTTPPRETGASAYLRIGDAITPSLVISGETNGWAKTINGDDVKMGSLMAVAQWYPKVTSGFYLQAGAGLGSYQETGVGIDDKALGGAFQAGLGYDLRVGRNFSLTPYASYVTMAHADVKSGGASTGATMGSNNMQYGIGFTWH